LIRAGESIPAPGLHAQPAGPDYHQLSNLIGGRADASGNFALGSVAGRYRQRQRG
jgi:hypothetical protein